MNLYYEVEVLKDKIPLNTYRTLLGQLYSGDVKGAERGILKIKRRLEKEAVSSEGTEN